MRSRRGNPKYDWPAIQGYYDEGHSYRECRAKFGFCGAAWTKAVARGALKARARAWPLPFLLATSKSRVAVKKRLLDAGILENRCSRCGIAEWQGGYLSCHIDHINGVRDDHRLENLRMLCPNCHSQTDTYGGKNMRRKRLQESGALL
jgi:Zn finger protein HypA/HybF involved in hydrogenase expression